MHILMETLMYSFSLCKMSETIPFLNCELSQSKATSKICNNVDIVFPS